MSMGRAVLMAASLALQTGLQHRQGFQLRGWGVRKVEEAIFHMLA